MSKKGKGKVFWGGVLEDRDLVFFAIGAVIWGVNLGVELGGLNTESWILIFGRIIVPVLFILGIALYVRKYYLLANMLTSTKHLPVVFVVGRSGPEAKTTREDAEGAVSSLTGFYSFKQMEKSFPVSCEDLMHYQRNRFSADPEQWRGYIADSLECTQRFRNAVPGEKVYHIFIYGPAALAIGLGASFGVKYPMVIYQQMNGQYQPVINLKNEIRRIKQIVSEPEYKYIHTNFPAKLTPDTAVVLDNASHSAVGDVRTYLNNQGQRMAIVDVWNRYEGNLTETDWIPVVRELYSVIHKLQSSTETTRFHLFFTIPVAMAFGLGAAIGHFVPVTVYNWEPASGTYFPVFKLNELDSSL